MYDTVKVPSPLLTTGTTAFAAATDGASGIAAVGVGPTGFVGSSGSVPIVVLTEIPEPLTSPVPVSVAWFSIGDAEAGTKVTFQREGYQGPGKMPANIVFIIRDKAHPLFKRDESNIRYTCPVSLKDALCGTTVQIPTLTGEKVSLDLSREVVKPTTTRRIQGGGLPYPKEPNRRGDLIVSFDIKFPDKLTSSAKEILSSIL